MMICKADFEELFPTMTKAKRRGAFPYSAGSPSKKACIDRWEDDGGRTLRIPQQRRRTGAVAQLAKPDDGTTPDLAEAGMALAMIPAVAVYGAASAVLATQGKLLGGAAPHGARQNFRYSWAEGA